MSSTNKCEFSYPGSDFVASAGIVNVVALKQELITAALTSVTIDNVTNLSPNGAVIHATGLISAADKTSMDAVVAAHTGISFSVTPIRANVPALASDDSGSLVQRTTLTTGPLRAGNYLLTSYIELANTTNSDVTYAHAQLTAAKGTATPSVVAESTNNRSNFISLSRTLLVIALDGESFTYAISFERVGVAGNAARVQRASLVLTMVESGS